MRCLDEVVQMLAGWFRAAYEKASAAVGAAAALLDEGVQEMRRLYVVARARCCA